MLIKILKIAKNSPDADSLINWKQGSKSTAGYFPERCYEVIQRRTTREKFGNMTIGDVNDLLDELAANNEDK